MINVLFASLALFVSAATDPMPIGWDDLIPEGEEPSAGSYVQEQHDQVAAQSGSGMTVPELDGVVVQLPGFMLPLDYTEAGKVSAFLLVPYYGACIHVPPPPPNQIIFVDTTAAPVEAKGLWDPVIVTGLLESKMNINGLGDAAYTMTLDLLEPYGY